MRFLGTMFAIASLLILGCISAGPARVPPPGTPGVLWLSAEDVDRVRQAIHARGILANVRGLEDELSEVQGYAGIRRTGEIDAATLHALGFGSRVIVDWSVPGVALLARPSTL